MLFILIFALTLLIFMFALVRRTIGMNFLSSVLWFGLSFVVFGVADPTSGLTQGSSYIFLIFGIVMLSLTFVTVFQTFKERQKEKERKIAEDVGV